MKRLILSAILAAGFHIALIAFMPSILKKNDKIVLPEIKHVLVTLSYKQPTIKKNPLKPDIQKKILSAEKIEPPTPVTEIKPEPASEPMPEKTVYHPLKKQANKLLKKKKITASQKKIQKNTAFIHEPIKEKALSAKKVENRQIKPIERQPSENQLPVSEKPIAPGNKDITPEQDQIKFAKPIYKENPSPVYPVIARKRGYQGIVELSVLVSEKGNVSAIKIFKSSGHTSLDHKAVTTVKTWQFEPGTKNNIPQKMWVKIPVKFELK